MLKYWEILYSYLPVNLQNLAISSYGFVYRKKRFGGIFDVEYKKALDREHYTQNDWIEYQKIEMRKILINAYFNVPFYKELFTKLGYDDMKLASFEIKDLQSIPFLTKSDYRTFGSTLLLSKKIAKNGEFHFSSGSTGTPTKTYYSKSFLQKYYGIFEARVNNWAGVTSKASRGTFGPRRILPTSILKPPYYRYNHAEKQTYFSAFHVSLKTAPNYIEGLLKRRIDYMTGYAMSNYFLAKSIKELGLKAPKLKAVITSSEKLTKEMRDVFREVYDCETFDSYNGVEACNLISECEHHRLHISPDVGIVEILDSEGKEVKLGEMGEVVSTGLLNFDQPLIRYKMGDYISLSLNQNCPCGRKMPVVEEIIGRIMDTVTCLDGRKIVSFYRVFTNLPKIIESQLIQEEISIFKVNLVTTEKLSLEEESLIISRIISQVGDASIKINYLQEIPKGPNGKFKSVISKLNQSREINI